MNETAPPPRLVIVNDDSVARGGATEMALASIRGLRRRGVPVTLIAGDGGYNPELEALGVATIGLGEHKLLDTPRSAVVRRGLYNPRTVRLLGDWIARNDAPDTVYHLHTWTQILSPSVFRALAPVSRRLVVTAHDFFLVCPNGAYVLFGSGRLCPHRPLSLACVATNCDRRNYAHKLWRVARQAVQAGVLRFGQGVPRILAIHDNMRPLLERGGVPPAAITTVVNPVRAWSETRIPAEANREFVFVGRLDEEKGADLAARAARRAGVTLRIIGDGPMMDVLRAAHPEVRFSGRQSWSAVSQTVLAARALVMPSRYPEPFGLVAGEALWSGIPVVAAETALIAPAIVARGAGLSCNPRDEAAMAAAMRRIASSDAETQGMSVNAFENTRDLAQTPEAWLDQLQGIYAACAGAPPRPALVGAAGS